MVKALRPLEARFVAEYMVDFSITKAAIRAGYSPKSVKAHYALLDRPHVAAEVYRRCKQAQFKLEVDADDVRRGFARIATDPRTLDEGGPTHGERIQAWREIGKLLGLYTNKIQVSGNLTLTDLLLAADAKQATLALPAPATH